MPKAASTSSPTGNSPQNINSLGRNQACHRCRRKKLKCDANYPCGACSRSHAYAVKHKQAKETDPVGCEYDDPEDLIDGGRPKIQRLETQIAELEEQLRAKDKVIEEKDRMLALCRCGRNLVNTPGVRAGLTAPGVDIVDPAPSYQGQMSVDSVFASAPMLPGEATPSPNIASESTFAANPSDFQVSRSAWPLNLPPPDVLIHLVETFFASVPLATRLIHQPSFMADLQQPPNHPEFPHVSLLHAICGLASLYSPIIRETTPDLSKGIGPSKFFHSALFKYSPEGRFKQGPQFTPTRFEDIIGDGEVGFGAAHIRWAANVIRRAIYTGDRLLQLLQATIICAWYNYSTGMHLNLYTWLGVANRLVLPLGLNVGYGYEPLSRFPPQMTMIMPEPWKIPVAEIPRNVYWIYYSMERVYTSPTVWPLISQEDDISQTLPGRLVDFVLGLDIPSEGRQRLHTPGVFTTHPRHLTDPFPLYIKASSLLGRVKSFNGRFRLKFRSKQGFDSDVKLDPRETAEFFLLDNSIMSFLESIPKEFKDPVHPADGGKLDPVLYSAHLLPHMAMILLHDPHADILSETDFSAKRILAAARATLDLMYKLCATTYDLLYLDHTCSLCWFVAGTTIVRFLKAKLDAGDAEEASKMKQEFDIVRFMLSSLGERCTIGLRQIRLLDDMYITELGGTPESPKDVPGAGEDIIFFT